MYSRQFEHSYYNYEVYVSVNGLDYIKAGEKKDNTPQTKDGDTYTFDTKTIRFVKVKMLSNSANPSMHINELRVYGIENTEYKPPIEDIDTTSIAYQKPARSYSNSASYPVSNINDGMLSTSWQALYYPAYIDIDLEGNYNINKIQVVPDFKDLQAYYQYSIFKGPITPSKLILLKKELQKAINKKEDCVSIIKLQSEDSFDEEVLGSQKEENKDSLII